MCGDAPADVLGVEGGVGQCGAELRLGELGERLAQATEVPIRVLVDVEHPQTSTPVPAITARRPVAPSIKAMPGQRRMATASCRSSLATAVKSRPLAATASAMAWARVSGIRKLF